MAIDDVDSLETCIYTIAHDLSHQKVSTVDEALQQRPRPILIVTKSNVGRTKSHFNDLYFVHSAYQLLRPGTTDPFYEEEGWRLLEVTELRNRSREVYFTLADPTGATRLLQNEKLDPRNWSTFFQLSGICNVLRLLRFLGPYQSWQHVEDTQGDVLTALAQVDLTAPYYTPEMVRTKRRLYLWKLSNFLTTHNSMMSQAELRQHLVRNQLADSNSPDDLTTVQVHLILQETQAWLEETVGAPTEVLNLTRAFPPDAS